MPRFTHLFFDLDNTIFDFGASSELALKIFADAIQEDYNAHFKEVYHRHNLDAWTKFEMGLIDSTTLRKDRFEKTALEFGKKIDGLLINRKYLRGLVEHPRFIDDAEDTLQHFSTSHSLAAITNGLKEVQRPRLIKVGFDRYFDAIVVSDEIGVAKPDAAYFQYAWDKVNRPEKNKVLVIGDNPVSDIQGGNNFGFITCLFDPYHKHKDHEASYKISSLKELQGIVHS